MVVISGVIGVLGIISTGGSRDRIPCSEETLFSIYPDPTPDLS